MLFCVDCRLSINLFKSKLLRCFSSHARKVFQVFSQFSYIEKWKLREYVYIFYTFEQVPNVFQMITLLMVVLCCTFCCATINNNQVNIEPLMDHGRCL